MAYDPTVQVPRPIVRALRAMAGYARPWYLCGGWAVDAWLGRQTREHKDVDIAVFKDDLAAFREHFAGWKLVAHDVVEQDAMEPWDGRALLLPAHIHTTRGGFELDVQVNEHEGGQWLLSRQPRVAVDLESCAGTPPLGVLTLAPELLLFYKTFEARPDDEADLGALLPHLSPEQSGRLRAAVALVHPVHPWLERLGQA